MRRADWQQRLTAFLAENSGRAPGVGWDGFLFVAAAVEEMTGRDLARGFRGYRTEAQGLRKFKAKGFGGPEDVIAAALSQRDRPRAGDVVAFDGGALGIWQGTLPYVMGPHGWALWAEFHGPFRGYEV